MCYECIEQKEGFLRYIACQDKSQNYDVTGFHSEYSSGLANKRGLDPRKPPDTDEAEISQRVGGSDTNLHVIYVPEEDGVSRPNPSKSSYASTRGSMLLRL
jgi:hypothetical protein